MANVITVSEFRTKFDEFSDTSTYSDSLCNNAIDLMWCEVEQYKAIDDSYLEKLQYYLSAHYLVILKDQNDKNFASQLPNQALELGPAVQTFVKADYDINDISIAATSYGQIYLRLLKTWTRINTPYLLIG